MLFCALGPSAGLVLQQLLQRHLAPERGVAQSRLLGVSAQATWTNEPRKPWKTIENLMVLRSFTMILAWFYVRISGLYRFIMIYDGFMMVL